MSQRFEFASHDCFCPNDSSNSWLNFPLNKGDGAKRPGVVIRDSLRYHDNPLKASRPRS